ncbi:hypothetical protein PQR02_37950 [Paraburkholderia sediminicola]|uniref:Uncharacterized protein n=1 Tax=Paraburkholderia rhynchosiae TaxID=487049 RepID=A0ACC7NN52_9BURK
MPLTSQSILFCFLFAGLCNAVSADADSSCLQHLGGGYEDTICYGNLSTSLTKDNKRIYAKVHAEIPTGNPHAKLLEAYMAAQDNALKFCELPRDAGAGWEQSPEGSMYPALYAECVYDVRKSQNAFLTDLLKMSEW